MSSVMVPISVPEEILAAYRRRAAALGMSVEEVIQRVVAEGASATKAHMLERFFRIMEEAGARSQGTKWKREDLYDL